MRRFWIFNHYATTPKTGPLLRHYYFAEYLKEKDIETTVFAANELHQTGTSVDTMGKPYLRTEEEGVPFVFVKTSKYRGNGISRVFNMLSFFFGLLRISKKYARQYGKPDLIMGSSAHPLTSIAGILAAKRFHVPVIVEVRDLWPEAIFSFGKVKMDSLIGRALSAGEKWMYVHADAIVFTKEGDVDHIKDQPYVMNYMSLGDWMSFSPIWKKKLEQEGIESVKEALYGRNNVYLICSFDKGLEYLVSLYLNVECTEVDDIPGFEIYSLQSL